MMQNILRSVKYFLHLCVLCAAVIFAMHFAGLLAVPLPELPALLFSSWRGWVLVTAVVVLSAAYPFTGFITRRVEGDIDEDRERIVNAFNVRIGHMIVPVGLTNSHHEPNLYFGTVRPESETTILPSTWHETGIAFLGYFNNFRYEAMLVSGLDPNGFSSENWIGSGRQKIFEKSTFTNPAVAARLEYSGVRNLRLAASGYYGNTAKNSSKPYAMAGVKGTVTIGSFDAQYMSRNLIARANFIYGTITDSKEIYDINRKYFNSTGYPITPFGKAAMAYGAEVGYNILSFFNTKERLFPFIRYEYYNTGQQIASGTQKLPRYKRDLITVGLNYYLLSSLVLKFDYSHRRIGGNAYNSEDTFGVTLAYTGWFFSK